jgi:hypothetical protein
MLMAETHGAYKAMRLAKQGHLPKGSTQVGKAVLAIEKKIIEHFGGELNNLQQIQLFNMLPLVTFLLMHPGINKKGKQVSLNPDWRWAFSRVESGMKVLVQLGNSKRSKKVPNLQQYIEQTYDQTEEESS